MAANIEDTMQGEALPPQLIVRGTPISPGLTLGLTYLHCDALGPVDSQWGGTAYNVETEFARLDQATAQISNDLLSLASRVEKEIDARLAEVFGAHNQMLNDGLLRDEIKKEIVENLVTAGSAVKSVFLRWETRFLLMESAFAREKGDDLRDISIRLRNALAGITVHPLEKMPQGCVLVAQGLLPSDTIFLSARSTAAVLLEHGATGSHAALFARQMGIPCISAIPDILQRFSTGATALVDADAGVVTVHPAQAVRDQFNGRIARHAEQLIIAKTCAREPAVTQDAVRVHVNANVGCNEDSRKAAEHGADRIGLYRLEQFYIGRLQPPSCAELIAEMRHTLSPFQGKVVCVRLLDAGSDKPLPFIGFMAEANPALGRRGIRLMCEYPELLQTQLRAVIDLMEHFDIEVLIPMVALPSDVILVREILDDLCAKQGVRSPRLGAMIETPAAALSAGSIAPYVDFMSFGTNDLTQYAFAADRENAAVERYFTDTSDVIFRLLELVHQDVPDMPLSVCGELAGRQNQILRMLRCGIRSLSVAPPLIPMVKATVRAVTIAVPPTHVS